MQIISIRQAEKLGLKHYFTGKPCNHGHLCERYVSTWRCVKCTTDRVLAWQIENPAKKLAKQRRYAVRQTKERKLADSRRDHETERQRRNRWRIEIAGRAPPDVCELCFKPDPREKIVWDHCHRTGKFRGWLCDRCNKTIGAAEDSPTILRAMADYVERHNGSTNHQD
jgi:hypothetical protein